MPQRGGDDARLITVNADDPVSGSTLALVVAATDCGALLTADVGRGDLPDLLPRELPWLTWVTTPRIPAASAAGPNDRLLVADPDWRTSAVAAGWNMDAVTVAGWPRSTDVDAPSDAPIGDLNSPITGTQVPAAAIIADTVSLDPPEKLDEFSSHLLLWNSIRQELQKDPLAAGADAEAFLANRMRHFGVNDASLDRPLFVGSLIWPAVMQGIARRLIADGVALRLYGNGWSDLAGLSSAAAGPVTSRRHLREIAAGITAIVGARPATWRNELYSLKRTMGARTSAPAVNGVATIPVIRTAGRTFGAIRHDLSQALAGKWTPPSPVPPLDLLSVLKGLSGSR